FHIQEPQITQDREPADAKIGEAGVASQMQFTQPRVLGNHFGRFVAYAGIVQSHFGQCRRLQKARKLVVAWADANDRAFLEMFEPSKFYDGVGSEVRSINQMSVPKFQS